eukprot:3655717-Alexandrium_andersonii.AAC.1
MGVYFFRAMHSGSTLPPRARADPLHWGSSRPHHSRLEVGATLWARAHRHDDLGRRFRSEAA